MTRNGVLVGALLLSAILVLLPCATAQPPWNPGDSWAFKWERDYSASGDLSTGNYSFSGTYEGKAVYAYYVEYVGMENDYYRFNFHGVHYSWANIDATYHATTILGNMSGTIKFQQRAIWVEFYGYFYLKEKNITAFAGEHKVYALYKMEYTVYSKEDLDYSMQMHTTYNSGVMDMVANAKGSFNLSLVLNFDEGLPFLPGDEGNYYHMDSIECNYSGHAKARIIGKWNISGQLNETSLQYGGDINVDVDKDYSGTTSVWYSFDVTGNSVKRPGFLNVIGTKVLDKMGCKFWYFGSTSSITRGSQEPDIKGLVDESARESTATYNPSKGYYTSEKNEVYGDSKSADKGTVNAIISNPKATYGGYTASSSETGGAGSSLPWLLIVALVIIVVVIAVVVGVVLMRKKKQPPVAQQYQQAYAMPPQYQQPQYPQQQYPQPPAQYPPQQPQQPQQPQPPTF